MRHRVIFVLLVVFTCVQAPLSNATHISKPVVIDPKTEYAVGERVTIRGWVNYDEEPTAGVLLNFKVVNSDTVLLERSFPSDELGYFVFEFETKNLAPGRYDVLITSQCWEAHRQICTHQSQTVSIDVGKRAVIPDWVRNNAKWWSEGIISDGDFVQGIQYLIKNNIIVVPEAVPQALGSGEIPGWIKNNAEWWSKRQISDSDFLNGIKYMIMKGIIRL